MPKLDDTLETVIQRTGSTSGNPVNEAEAAAFRAGIRLDVTSIMNQINNVYYPLFNSLSKVTQLDALDFGITGNVLFTHVNATAADADAYWDSTQGRVRTIRETIDVLLVELANLENQITTSSTPASTYDDSALVSSIGINQLNLTQLRRDTVGENYGFDNDALADLTFPLAQHLDALGAFFTGFPTSGLTYPDTYPTLALSVNLSDINVDTTIPISGITNLATQLATIGSFVGMSSSSDSAPTYSAHGALSHISDGQDLELAVYTLDAALAGFSGAFTTTSGVTSNAGGTYASDDFVFGSPGLGDTGTASEDNRFFFDKSLFAFRAGSVTGTEWNAINRGSGSFAWGLDTTASGDRSFAGGEENSALALASVVLGGGAAGTGSSIDATSNYSVILNGMSNAITTSTNALIGTSDSGTISGSNGATILNSVSGTITSSLYGMILGGDTCSVTTASRSTVVSGQNLLINNSDYSTIVSGYNNQIDSTGDFNVILSGGQSLATNKNEILGTAQYAAVLSGLNNVIDSSGFSSILCGTNHLIDVTGGSGNNVVLGGSVNTIGDGTGTETGNTILNGTSNTVAGGSTYCLVSGQSNTVGTAAGNSVVFSQNAALDASNSAVVGGDNATVVAGADYSIVLAGDNNQIEQPYSAILGENGKCRYRNALTLGSGNIATGTDIVQWEGATTDATVTEIFLANTAATRLDLEDNRGMAFEIRVVGKLTSGTDIGDYKVEGTIVRGAGVGTTVLKWSNVVTNYEDVAGWDVAVSADTTNGSLKLDVTGAAATSIRWYATGVLSRVG
jgi:hypothetical protein